MTTSARELELGERFPIGVCEVELDQPLPTLEGRSSDGTPWLAVVVIARLHSVPVGMFVAGFEVGETSLSPSDLAKAVVATLGSAVTEHLKFDGLSASDLTAGGLPSSTPASCQQRRTKVLADAPLLSVVIPTRDRADRLGACLDSILACQYPADRLEIVVVDNVPVDDTTQAVVKRYGAAGHPLVYAREDAPGSASARNRGMEVVSHDLVVFTDDDAYADRWWLAELATAFANHPRAGAVTGMLLPSELETQAQLWFEEYGGFSRGFEERLFTIDRSSDPSNRLYPYAAGVFGTGNNMAFRRDALLDIGNFDPALGNGTPALGGVDSEVLLRTVLAGYPLVYQPRALVWHSHRREYASLRRQVYSYGVGLTSYLTKTMVHNPHLILDFARRVPQGVRFALASGSEKNSRKSTTYPSDLTRAELLGMARGFLAYPQSRRKMGRHQTKRALMPR